MPTPHIIQPHRCDGSTKPGRSIYSSFPQLKIVCSEFEMSWVPGFMARLDQIEDIAPRLHLPKLEMRASDYLRTRVWHGLINDTAACPSRLSKSVELLDIYVGHDHPWTVRFPVSVHLS
jgi:hypothetical protein